jgi:hypothetical protein
LKVSSKTSKIQHAGQMPLGRRLIGAALLCYRCMEKPCTAG